MTIRWALIGPGRHAERSAAPQLKKAVGAALTAVLSRDLQRGEAFARRHGIPKVHASLAELLRDPEIDAIYDASPDGLHAGHAIAAAEAGKHILVEKPLAVSVCQARAAIAACRRLGVQLGVVFNQRHEAVHQAARRLVRAGRIGEVRLAEVQIALRAAARRSDRAATWRSDASLRAGGITVSIGDHAYDTLAYLTGQQVVAVSAFTDARRDNPPDERVVSMLLRLSSGAIGYAAASFATPFARRPFAIHGSKGTLVIENSYAYLTDPGRAPTPTLTLADEAGTTVQRFPASECFRLEFEQFTRAIEGQGPPMTPPADALRALAVGEAIYDAVRTGQVTRVEDYGKGSSDSS